jgi:hypothetical protein
MAAKRCFHETHTLDTVVDVGEERAVGRNRGVFELGRDLQRRVTVKLGECLEEALRMASRKTCGMVGSGAMGTSLCQPD